MEDPRESPIYDLGWTEASLNMRTIWEGIREQYPNPEETIKHFDFFMVMIELRVNGAEWEEIATVAELNDMPTLAAETRKVIQEEQQ